MGRDNGPIALVLAVRVLVLGPDSASPCVHPHATWSPLGGILGSL